MRKKWYGKRAAAVITAAAMTISLTACGGTQATEQAPEETPPAESAETEGQQEQVQPDAEGSTETAGQYAVTEENENRELTMSRQPEASYWFPAQLLEWKAEEDEDLLFNVSSVPLAERVDIAELETVNATQNKDTRSMAISIMNGSTSGNSPHGLNKAEVNAFSYWQYVDLLVYWGGSSGEGLIVAPSADVVNAGHKNGVKVIGTVFMPQTAHGGKMVWLEDLLQKAEDGSYPVVDKLIEVAELYGFDGWFINQETEGTEEEPLTKDHAVRMQEFLSYYKEQAPDLELIYYDSMTADGEMDWQNALTEQNAAFLQTEDGTPVADDMFLNFWWTTEKLAPEELLKASAELAAELQIDPYSLYAGVDLQSNGYGTEINWSLFENPEGGTYTSLGLYCPSWAYFSTDMIQDFWKQENKLWVNAKGNPAAGDSPSGDTEWRGVSSYIVERTAVTSLPFVTNFSTGNGYGFYKNGQMISMLDWNNRSISDILPTYRYIIEDAGGNKLTADLDVGDAYYGGNSLILRGTMKAGGESLIKLYSAGLTATEQMSFTTTVKARGAEVSLDAVLTMDDGSEMVLEGDRKAGEDWTTVSYDTAALAGKRIKAISYRLKSDTDADGVQIRFGNITMAEYDQEETASVSNVRVLDSEFDEDSMYAGVRLAWDSDVMTDYYEIYRINQDESKSLLGVSNTNSFYINTLPRTDETNLSVFEVVPVNALLQEGSSSRVTMDWPDNSLPKAAFTADVTLAAPGETITFSSLCSQNTEQVTWTLTGADTETAQGDTVSVTYPEEGVYAVSILAENGSGSSEASQEGYIVITEKAAEGLVLLSQDAGTEADTYVNENEAPQFAVDGDYSKKWCATGSAPHEITLDLGSVKTVSAVDIYHAEAGGESADMNTKFYAIYVSEDGAAFEEVRSVTRNTAGTTHDTFAPVNARFVKLVVNKPTQGSDSAARIYEIEVYGLEEG
ncbi:MAG: discoidin domain-containing protein [Lachnospiraceae bacterium]|nr:discoidin domain-containing protein [Lachnospiraceae bacterium]